MVRNARVQGQTSTTEVPWPLDPRSLVAALSDTSFLLQVEIIKAELEEKSFNKLTVIDPPEFGDYVNNRDSWGQSSTLSTTSVKHI
jgi:septin family protein